MNKILLVCPLLCLILLVLVSPLAQITGAQTEIDFNDSNFATYYGNPDKYVGSHIDITGKIFHLIPARDDTTGIQVYQGGKTANNVIVSYAISSNFGDFGEDDCVSVKGTAGGTYEYTNAFGGTVSAPVVYPDSIIKIDCNQVINPAERVITVEQSQSRGGIKVTLHKVEFSDKNTRAYLTIENNNRDTDINFYDFNAKAFQGNRQFGTTSDYEIDYPKIESNIPAGIVEDGVVLFEPLDFHQNEATLQFEASKEISDIKFSFDIGLSVEGQIQQSQPTPPSFEPESQTQSQQQNQSKIISKFQPGPPPTTPIPNDNNLVLVDKWGSAGPGHGQFNHPASLENDENGQRIYVADLDNNRIQVLDGDGHFVTEWGTLGKGEGQFEGPGAVAVDADKKIVFVSDIRNNRIEKFDIEGNFITEWGTLGKGEGQFDHPGDIALDPDEEKLYITDIYNNRIQEFYYDGNFVAEWGSFGTGSGQFNRPAGISINPLDNVVYVSDTANNRIQVFDGDGNFIAKWGSLGTGSGQFNRPDGILFDPTEKLVYVADRKNNRVQILDSEGTFVNQWAISDSKSEKPIKPRDIALDSSGQIYVVDKENNNIYIYGKKYAGSTIANSHVSSAIQSANEEPNDILTYSNNLMSIELLYPANWKFTESKDKLAVTFTPESNSSDKFVSFQAKAVKIPSSNFSLSGYISTYLNLLRKTPQVISINETQKISISGSDAFSLLYNKKIDKNDYSVLQDLATDGHMLYVFTYIAPIEKYYDGLFTMKKVINSVKISSFPSELGNDTIEKAALGI